MDNFVVSARKYRPQRFEDVIGQQAIADTLKMAIKNNKLASAYLFCGPRGVGKTTCARIFAKAINCLNPHDDGEACDECDSCRSFNEQRSVNIQELNAAANNSVDDIRTIIEQVRIPPQLGKYKVIILDEVHMLSQAAGNALLKTLEEPPSYVIFILATTEKQKIMPTILSRCQIFDFNRMEISDIVSNLRMVADNEGVSADEDALKLIAQKADGGMRDALSIFDQVNNFSQGDITVDNVMLCINALDSDYYFRMTDLLLEHNIVGSMLLFNDIVNKGFNGGVFIGGLASHMRDLLMSRDQATMPLLNADDDIKQRYAGQAAKCSLKFLYYAIRIFDRCSNEYRTSYNKRLSVEITLIEAAQYGDDDSAGAGLGPAQKLKPIFTAQPAPKERSAAQPQTDTPSAPTPQADTPSAPMPSNARQHLHSRQEQPVIKINNARPSLKDAIAQARNQQTAPQTDTPSAPTADNAAQTTDNKPTTSENYQNETGNTPIRDFNDVQAEEAWQLLCKKMQTTNNAIATRMLAMPVKCLNENTLEVSLHNEQAKKSLQQIAGDIEQFMQQTFGKPDIKLQFTILPPEIIKIITNPTELLAKMRSDNPFFAQLVDELGLQPA